MTIEELQPRRSADVLAQRTGDKVVLLHLTKGMYYSLNTVGSRVWDLCDGTRTVAAVSAAIAGEFTVDEDLARSDVEELVADLTVEHLLVSA